MFSKDLYYSTDTSKSGFAWERVKKRKTWEWEKLLVTSNFTFPHNVFKRLVMQTRKNQGLLGKGLMNTSLVGSSCITVRVSCINILILATPKLIMKIFPNGARKGSFQSTYFYHFMN